MILVGILIVMGATFGTGYQVAHDKCAKDGCTVSTVAKTEPKYPFDLE